MARSPVPVKRQAEETSDLEDDASQTSIKRVKRERFDNDQSRRHHQDKEEGSGSENGDAEGNEDDGLDSDSGSASEGEYVINDYPDDEANVRAYTAAKEREKKFGAVIPEAGYIQKVIVQDFMCHHNTHVDFSKRLNFMVGHNGSGKSAILTAITVALGGKAAATGRGSGLKDLIRNRADKAVITLVMGNSGPQAYKPDVYDKGKIVIERTLDRNGSSSYRFKTEVGERRNVATKREELTHICQFWSITIDSPLTVLTQDAARSFLQSADERHLYKFFVQGTGLGDLEASYHETQARLNEIALVVQNQNGRMDDVNKNLKNLETAVGAAKALTEQKKEHKRTQCELAWAYVTTKETEVAEAKTKASMLQKKVDDLKESTRSCKAQFDDLDAQSRELEDAQKQLAESQKPLKDSQAKLAANLNQKKRVEKDLQDGIREAEKSIKGFQKTIDGLSKKIDDRIRAIDAAVDPAEVAVRAEIDTLTEKIRATRASIPVKEDFINTKVVEIEGAKTQLGREENELDNAKKQLNRSSTLLRQAEEQKGNRLHAFGQGIDFVMRDIETTRWEHSRPLGPLGMHVTLLNQTYNEAFHSQLGGIMCSFAVRTKGDRQTLMNILKKRNDQPNGYRAASHGGQKGFPPVITHAGDIFEFARGDRSAFGDTILSKLRVDNPEVLRILINASRIESTFVSPTILQANTEMDATFDKGLSKSSFVTADGFTTTGSRDNRQSGPMQRWRGSNLFATDMVQEIQARKADVQVHTEGVTVLRARVVEIESRIRALQREVGEARTERDQARTLKLQMEKRMNSLQAQLPIRSETDIAGWESSRTELQKQRGEVVTQLEGLKQSLEDAQSSRESMQEELTEMQRKIDDFEPERKRQQDAMIASTTQRAQVQNNMAHWEKSRNNTEVAKATADQEITTCELDLHNWATKAATFSDRIATERTVTVLDALMKKQKMDIEAAKKRSGVDIDQLHAQYRDAVKEKKKMENSIKSLEMVHKVAEKGLKRRKNWWTDHRSHVAVIARSAFISNLNKREQNFTGILDFDHPHERLQMIFTSKQRGSSVNDETNVIRKSAQNLSGGERSFATVSLLLALWNTVNSPLSCLDEWDVFLDAANRKVASGMLLDGAKDSDGRQYIFISPLSMQGTACGPHDRVIKLGDPERGQRQLDFERSQRR